MNPGTTSATVYIIENGTLKQVYAVGESYAVTDYTAMRETEDILIAEPIETGNTWLAEDGSARTITAVNMSVTVPYGTFDALEVTTENESAYVKNYYAVGVGLIKREFISKDDPSIIISSELEDMQQGATNVINMRFLLPRFQ